MKNMILLSAACASLASIQVAAQNYPAKAIRIIVPVAPGGNVDFVVRGVAQAMSEKFGQQVIVDNRPSASSIVGTQMVARSAPDGYTLLAMANTFATVPPIMPTAGYDPIKDFAAVTLTCLVPQVLEVNPALPVRTVKEFIALAKSRPGQLAYGSGGTGGTGHFAGELFSRQAGIKMLHVPYKGAAPALIDVISGNVQLMFDQLGPSAPHIASGKVRALGLTSLKRAPMFPNIPTIDESGLKGFEDITFNGLMAPAGTPREVLVRLQSEVARVVRLPELHKRYVERGVDLAASASPEEFAAYIKAEFETKGKLAREVGIRME
ncbi:MAG: tripartite tricarboxylate transporter substrate binding protein [Betaproteobacteria bacterium]|nr:tripartite tricarboxylate transporter substrate binding protein [Betaproteobacteria bacterium]